MMKLHEVVLVGSPVSLLGPEHGIFEVVSSGGAKFRITCELGRPMQTGNIGYAAELRRSDICWRIEKVGELPPLQKGKSISSFEGGSL